MIFNQLINDIDIKKVTLKVPLFS